MDLRPPLEEVAARFAEACERCGVDYALIGGLAAGAYGATRPTMDVDACISLSASDGPAVQAFLNELAGLGFRLNKKALARRLDRGHTMLFLWLGLVRLDIMLSRPDQYWQEALQHRRRVEVEGRRLWLASPEDVTILKLAAARDKDLEVCRQILAAQLPHLDLERMQRAAGRLAVRAPDLPARLTALVAEVEHILDENADR